MPQDVIDRIHALAKENPPGLEFRDRNRNLISDIVDFDDPTEPDNNFIDRISLHDLPVHGYPALNNLPINDRSVDPIPPDNNQLAGVEPSSSAQNQPVHDSRQTTGVGQNNQPAGVYEPESDESSQEPPSDIDDDNPSDNINSDDQSQNTRADSTASHNSNNTVQREQNIRELENDMDQTYGTRLGHEHNLRPRRRRNDISTKFRDTETQLFSMAHEQLDLKEYATIYAKIHCQFGIPESSNIMMDETVTTILTQHHVSKGLKVFGNDGVEAVLKELRQLHERMVMEPIDGDNLSPHEKRAALQYLMFLKQKRCGKIKGRGCADGRKQRLYMNKDQVSAPTVATESLLLTCLIDALERRKVVTVDIPGAFMQSDMEGEVTHMKLEGEMVKILERIDPKLYSKYKKVENGRSVLYVKLKKALYGTLQAALLFWKNLTTTLIGWGFEINPYDWCVANKMVSGKQLTVVWHVDDLKISHLDQSAIGILVDQLRDKYETTPSGNKTPLTVHTGTKHDYLGMTLDYSVDRKVIVDMTAYAKKLLDELPTSFRGTATTPAASHLFDVNENCEKLDKDDAEFFHHVVAQLLFLGKRGRPDLLTAIAFMTTRVKAPDVDDYKKLQRVTKYLDSTSKLVLTLEADDTGTLHWWIDAAFAVHHNLRSHTGAMLSMGKGAIFSTSTKQKINTKSSTEAEFVGVDDLMHQILWTRLFLTAQGFHVNDNVIYQDNESAIKLQNNGRGSSGKRTRHINIRYYFITDRIANGDVRVQHCPTDRLIADFYTKALQGHLFRLFRSLILNLDDKIALSMGTKEKKLFIPGRDETISRQVQQECVKENVKENVKNNDESSKLQRTYADVCKCTYNYDKNNTRSMVASKDPGLLVKLRNVAKQCMAKPSINTS